jgi:hypothetical protein
VAKNITPRFEFGFGLSYSTFSAANIAVENVNEKDKTSIQKANEKHDGSG